MPWRKHLVLIRIHRHLLALPSHMSPGNLSQAILAAPILVTYAVRPKLPLANGLDNLALIVPLRAPHPRPGARWLITHHPQVIINAHWVGHGYLLEDASALHDALILRSLLRAAGHAAIERRHPRSVLS